VGRGARRGRALPRQSARVPKFPPSGRERLSRATHGRGTLTLPFGGSGLGDHSTGQVTLSFVVGSVPDTGTSIQATYQWSQRITAYQGRTRLDRFSGDGSINQRFTLSRTRVLVDPLLRDDPPVIDPSRFEVWVGDPGAPFGTETGALWRRVESLVEAGPLEEVYEVIIGDQDDVTVRFGDNNSGKALPAGIGNVYVIYRTGGCPPLRNPRRTDRVIA